MVSRQAAKFSCAPERQLQRHHSPRPRSMADASQPPPSLLVILAPASIFMAMSDGDGGVIAAWKRRCERLPTVVGRCAAHDPPRCVRCARESWPMRVRPLHSHSPISIQQSPRSEVRGAAPGREDLGHVLCESRAETAGAGLDLPCATMVKCVDTAQNFQRVRTNFNVIIHRCRAPCRPRRGHRSAC